MCARVCVHVVARRTATHTHTHTHIHNYNHTHTGDIIDGDAQTSGEKCTSLVVVGGVAANKELRLRLLDLLKERSRRDCVEPLPLVFPPGSLCTDNGAMVAWAGIEKLSVGISDSPHGQEVIPRWPLGTLRK